MPCRCIVPLFFPMDGLPKTPNHFCTEGLSVLCWRGALLSGGRLGFIIAGIFLSSLVARGVRDEGQLSMTCSIMPGSTNIFFRGCCTSLPLAATDSPQERDFAIFLVFDPPAGRKHSCP